MVLRGTRIFYFIQTNCRNEISTSPEILSFKISFNTHQSMRYHNSTFPFDLDYTHAKQNLGIIVELISEILKLPDKETGKLSRQIFEQLWNGNINGIANIIQERLFSAKKPLKAALKKLGKYFKDHSKFQYRMYREKDV